VNGVGFAVRSSNYEAVGGFARDTWCLDETISVRTWLKGPLGCVCLPGPPLIHYFGGATLSNPPAHDLHTNEAWAKAMGMTKEEAGALCYAKMFDREAAILAETKAAEYSFRGVTA
jgi:hypothetical protein